MSARPIATLPEFRCARGKELGNRRFQENGPCQRTQEANLRRSVETDRSTLKAWLDKVLIPAMVQLYVASGQQAGHNINELVTEQNQ